MPRAIACAGGSACRPRRVGRRRGQGRRFHGVLFALGDAALLVVVALIGTWVMHRSHASGLGLLMATLLGMAGAMLAQVGLASLVAPLLGSIESMVPSAVIGVAAPSLVCLLVLLGLPWHSTTLYVAAAGLAVAFALWLDVYAWRCRRRFARYGGRVGTADDACDELPPVDGARGRDGIDETVSRRDGVTDHGR